MVGYIPSNLDLSAERHSGKYYFILTSLYYGKIFDKRNKTNSFISLNGKTLLSIIGGRYKYYITHLVNAGIIETNNLFLVGEKSKGYRFTEKYRNVKFKRVIIMDKNIIKKITSFKDYLKIGIRLPQHKYIYDCLNHISIQENEARYFIEQSSTTAEQYNSYSISIDMIAGKNYFFVADKTAGRVHNNITNLPSDLRPFLRYNNQELVEIDIANSQPFLFNLLIIDYFINNTQPSPYLPPSYDNQYSTSYPDIILYKELTSNGKFYEYMMQYLPIMGRDEFKKKLFGRIFYNDDKKFLYEEWSIFQDIFPTVAHIISFYKRNNYKDLAISLQKVEADIIINRIVIRLEKESIYCLTIHDSILTTPNNAEIVKQIMLEEFEKHFGLIPTIRIKGGYTT